MFGPLALAPLLLALASGSAQAREWTLHGGLVTGLQFDMVRGPNDRLHVISSGGYYQLDIDGSVLLAESVTDEGSGELGFPPAIAVGADGTVHAVTREGGDYEGGHDIRYRRRRPDGSWDRDYLVGSRQRRNYVVGVAVLGDAVILSSTVAGDDVWGDVVLWQAAAGAATQLGNISAVWRADCGTRLRSSGERLFLGSGVPDPDGTAYLMSAAAGGDLVAELRASIQGHSAGSGRKGFTDLYVDGGGRAHLSYGALEQAYYARYDATGSLEQGDVLVADALGTWHLSAGLSAVAASDDGQTVVMVALRSDGSQSASDSDLLWTLSLDGGQSWEPLQDLGVNTSGGEGRLTPRLASVGDRFFLLYAEQGSGHIALATLDLPGDEPVDTDVPGDDTDTPGDDSEPLSDDSDTGSTGPDAQPDEPGCGCGASPVRAWSWLLLLGMAAVFRRRR